MLQLRARTPSPVTHRVLRAALSSAAVHYDPKPALELYRILRDDEQEGLDLGIANLTLAACSYGGDLASAMSILQDLQVRAAEAIGEMPLLGMFKMASNVSAHCKH